jgi:small subunit ribosomal protein S17
MAKTLTGVVSSNKPDKTIIVTVTTHKTHPIYKKAYSRNTKFMAHDEKNECLVGDKVVIEETRPLSARKRYTFKKLVLRPAIVEEKEVA